MSDIERRLRDLGERMREEQGSDFPSPSMKSRIRTRRFSTVAVASLAAIAVVATGTFAAGWVGSSPVPPAGPSGPYSADVPGEVWVVTEKGWLEDPGLNLSWGRNSDTDETLACVANLPPGASRVELVNEATGDVLSWGDNFVAGADSATVCAHNLDPEVLVGIANDPSAHKLVIDDDLEVRLVRTDAIPIVESPEVECDPAVGFEPTYLPEGWVPELQKGGGDGEDPFGNIVGHYGAQGLAGDHEKVDAGFINLIGFDFRFEPPDEGNLIVLGQPAEFDEENGTIDFAFEGCAFALVGAGVGREELVPFAEGLQNSALQTDDVSLSDRDFTTIAKCVDGNDRFVSTDPAADSGFMHDISGTTAAEMVEIFGDLPLPSRIPEWVGCHYASGWWGTNDRAGEGPITGGHVEVFGFSGPRHKNAEMGMIFRVSLHAGGLPDIPGEWEPIEGREDWYQETSPGPKEETSGTNIRWLAGGNYYELVGLFSLDVALEIADSVR